MLEAVEAGEMEAPAVDGDLDNGMADQMAGPTKSDVKAKHVLFLTSVNEANKWHKGRCNCLQWR